jgi:hypothetical protein
MTAVTTRRTPTPVPDLRVETSEIPEPGLLRPAIEAALAGRPFPAGPESTVGHAVADAVAGTVADAVADSAPGARGASRGERGSSC